MDAPTKGASPLKNTETLADGTDLRRLCNAIAVHETRSCTDTIAPNNCHNIMTWDRGFREGKTFASKEESTQYCMRLWKENYGRFPDYTLASRYVCGPNAKDCKEIVWGWLATVKQHY